jgi:hypothetical protein
MAVLLSLIGGGSKRDAGGLYRDAFLDACPMG